MGAAEDTVKQSSAEPSSAAPYLDESTSTTVRDIGTSERPPPRQIIWNLGTGPLLPPEQVQPRSVPNSDLGAQLPASISVFDLGPRQDFVPPEFLEDSDGSESESESNSDSITGQVEEKSDSDSQDQWESQGQGCVEVVHLGRGGRCGQSNSDCDDVVIVILI